MTTVALNSNTSLKAVYDLRVLPPTFDFLGFLCCADAHRIENFPDHSSFDVIFICGESLRGIEFANVTSQQEFIKQRTHSILLPIANTYPTVSRISIWDASMLGGRIEIDNVFFPLEYSATDPKLYKYYKNWMLWEAAKKFDLRVISYSENEVDRGRALLKRLCGDSAPVIFTIRNNRYGQDRSRDNTERFLEIAKLIAKDYPVVIIPDTSDACDGLDTELPICTEASLCIDIRGIVYQAGFANIFGSNGPGLLGILNKNVKYLSCEWAIGHQFRADWFEKQGLVRDTNPFSYDNPHQVVYWDHLTQSKAVDFLANLKS